MAQKNFEEVIKRGPYAIRFPRLDQLDQDEEWCEVEFEGKWKKIRFHDYHEVFKIPGLYETIFYRTLRCVSPIEVSSLFKSVMTERHIPTESLGAIDFGAGNGMAGEALQSFGLRRIIGVDILEEAKQATLRDRPWVYDEYLIDDLTKPNDATVEIIKNANLNTLVTVAALGYGDIPVRAFFNAFNMISTPGWVAMNIKDDFLKSSNKKGFSGLINSLYEKEIFQCEAYRRYCHRLSITGEPLYYIALVGQKLAPIPESLLNEVLES
ncbi:MAG: methyltransferase [Oligoflexus sp.]